MCVQIFHMVNIDVPASVGAPPLNTATQYVASELHDCRFFFYFPFFFAS